VIDTIEGCCPMCHAFLSLGPLWDHRLRGGTVSNYQRQFIHYVANTGGGATKANFIEDWEPIGQRVWDELCGAGLIELNENQRVILTEKGRVAYGEGER
jgi:hypothetical protein